ncbi:MAG TPA: type II secretion system protein GspM [Bryobacteraceae bacterium]|nr:type II secretion system protein GspM [Bryobacteraceae bacterium]
MTLQARDKRALWLLGAALLLALLYWAATRSPSVPASATLPADSIERSERRLTALGAALATVGGKEDLLRQASAELAAREKGLIPGDTASQAQAQLLQIVGRIAKQQTPPIEIRQAEFAQPRPYGDAYGVVSVSVTIDCRTDELVNLLAGLTQQPELVSTEDIRFGVANPKSKSMPMRITISGLVPRRLVPEKKGLSSF